MFSLGPECTFPGAASPPNDRGISGAEPLQPRLVARPDPLEFGLIPGKLSFEVPAVLSEPVGTIDLSGVEPELVGPLLCGAAGFAGCRLTLVDAAGKIVPALSSGGPWRGPDMLNTGSGLLGSPTGFRRYDRYYSER